MNEWMDEAKGTRSVLFFSPTGHRILLEHKGHLQSVFIRGLQVTHGLFADTCLGLHRCNNTSHPEQEKAAVQSEEGLEICEAWRGIKSCNDKAGFSHALFQKKATFRKENVL